MRSLRLDGKKAPLIPSSIHNRGVIPLILLGLSFENLQLWFAGKQYSWQYTMSAVRGDEYQTLREKGSQ